MKPMLLPNEQLNIKDMEGLFLKSNKLDGIRCIFKNGEMLSRSLKQIPCKQLQKRFQPLKELSKKGYILDGEIYAHSLSFQTITHFVMTKDFESERAMKRHKKRTGKNTVEEIPNELKFHCFDILFENEAINSKNSEERYELLKEVIRLYPEETNDLVLVKQTVIEPKDVKDSFEKALKEGYEGLILRNVKAYYKFGRVTYKSNDAYKYKPFETFDAKIIGVEQATEAREGSEKKINELGRSVTSKKKSDRIPINRASGFVVEYNGFQLTAVLAMNNKEKEEVWLNRDSYLERTIEYKGMKIGAKNVPRHPVFIRYRDDKNA